MDIQKEREEFEAWHFKKYYAQDADKSFLYERFENKNEYVSYIVQHSWDAWQAAKSQEQSKLKMILCDEHLEKCESKNGVFISKHQGEEPCLICLLNEKKAQAKSQAMPKGFVLVPYDVAERCMGHISIAMCHPNNTNAENDVMQMDLDILESRVEAQEQSNG